MATIAWLALAVSPSLTSAESEIPKFFGLWDFHAISGPDDPEAYSWEVTLGPKQDLRQIDDQYAEVVQVDRGWLAYGIVAEPAHAADGASVPTTLAVTEPNVITLTVHHRAGNPAKGGAPFLYPVIAGPGWEGGLSTSLAVMPPPEPPLTSEEVDQPSQCVVPRLKGRSLKASKRLLREAKCLVGDVRKRGEATVKSGEVVRQAPKPGTGAALWTPVDLTLGA